jgi:hypothetical protein
MTEARDMKLGSGQPLLDRRRSSAVRYWSRGGSSSRTCYLLVLFIAVACTGTADATSAPGTPAISGTYVLQSVDGARLPYTLIDLGDTYKFTLLGDRLTFATAGTVTELDSSETINDGSVSRAVQIGVGSFVVVGNSIEVTWPQSGTYDYTLSSDLISVFEPTFQKTWVYRKQ